jgi:hypothetical protein
LCERRHGEALGWSKAGEGAGIVGSIVGAIIVLLIYGFLAGRRPVRLRCAEFRLAEVLLGNAYSAFNS